MDYAYSPIPPINNDQRIIIFKKEFKSYFGKRIIKTDNDNQKIIRKNQKFINSISKNKLSKLLTKKNKIVIKYENEEDLLHFIINGDKITYQYVIDELYKQGLNLIDIDQDHIYIEDFISYDDYTFNIITGS
jgi:hypothetical protein